MSELWMGLLQCTDLEEGCYWGCGFQWYTFPAVLSLYFSACKLPLRKVSTCFHYHETPPHLRPKVMECWSQVKTSRTFPSLDDFSPSVPQPPTCTKIIVNTYRTYLVFLQVFLLKKEYIFCFTKIIKQEIWSTCQWTM